MSQIIEYQKQVEEFGKTTVGLPTNNTMFVFLENNIVRGVDFLCPCGCGTNFYLPVTPPPKQEHCWEYVDDTNGPTLRPSILHLNGCKSHFYITDGKVSTC